MAAYAGWRGAFIGAAIFGFAAALVLIVTRDPPRIAPAAQSHTHAATASLSGWKLLLSAPILLNFVFFMLTAVQGGGLTNFLVVALGDLHSTPVLLASTALTTMLFTSAAGVLLGGLLLTRTNNHTAVANICLAVVGVTSLMLAFSDFGAVGLLMLVSLSGLAGGLMAPSRDMILRGVTPPGAFGAVFGFVTNGFTLAGIIFPLLFGFMMDHGLAQWIFITVAVSTVFCAVTVVVIGRRWGHA
jgi:MFS family permease